MHLPLQAMEVCLRNKAHNQMSRPHGTDWQTDPKVAPLNDLSRSMMNDALRDIKGLATPGEIVAELKFGFWVA